MTQSRIAGLVAALTLVTMCGAPALAVAGETFRAKLHGFQEVPAFSTVAKGEFRAKISDEGDSIQYTLSYQNLEGDVTQGHIHFGQFSVNGGISVWLCGTASNPGPTGTPTCPDDGTGTGMVTGTVEAADVIGPADQGITAGEFAELVKALRAGVTYANVHSTARTAGEIRGQIRRGGGHKD